MEAFMESVRWRAWGRRSVHTAYFVPVSSVSGRGELTKRGDMPGSGDVGGKGVLTKKGELYGDTGYNAAFGMKGDGWGYG